MSNFYPRPPRGGRHRQLATGQPLHIFLSTPSARRATCSHGCRYCFAQFLSTPSARRATIPPRCFATRQKNFYPRPPRGGRPRSSHTYCFPDRFLSTPSARRATGWLSVRSSITRISIHALREEGDERNAETDKPYAISIHALREEGDRKSWGTSNPQKNFYPRPPRGGRQQKQRQNLYFQTNYTTFCTNLEEP